MSTTLGLTPLWGESTGDRWIPIAKGQWCTLSRIVIIGATVCMNAFCSSHGPLTRHTKLRVVHAPGMPGTFSPPPRVSDPVMHQGTCVTHVPWCMPGSLTNGFLWSRWRGKRSRHSRRMRNPQCYVSGMRPITARINSLWTSDTTQWYRTVWTLAQLMAS